MIADIDWALDNILLYIAIVFGVPLSLLALVILFLAFFKVRVGIGVFLDSED